MKNVTIKRVAFVFLVTLISLVASATAYGQVDVSTLLANPGFENGFQPALPGNLGIACPSAWLCTGSSPYPASAYVVTAAQYLAGADGLTGGKIVPGGTFAGTMPTPVEGSGNLYQLGLGTYAASTTYTLTLWIGTPLTVPFCGTPTADPNCHANVTPVAAINDHGQGGVLTFYWLGNGANQLKAISLPIPVAGQWISTTVTFNPSTDLVNGLPQGIGQSIGILIHEAGGANNEIINLDIVAACTCP